MKQNDIYLRHILDEVLFLLKTAKDLDYESFVENEMCTRAFSRSFEIIGEAVKNLPPDFRKKHDKIEWKKISGMRDKIIHHYFNVDYELLWDVVQNKLPQLRDEVEMIITQQ